MSASDLASEGDTRWWEDKADALLAIPSLPCYVYDADNIKETLAGINASLWNPTVSDDTRPIDTLYYAVKANVFPSILQLFCDAGLSFECVSVQELVFLERVLPGLSPSRIQFTPNFCGKADYAEAFRRGVNVTIDNTYPLEKWTEVFVGQTITLRLDPGVGKGHHDYVKTAGSASKFGIEESLLADLSALCKENNITVSGLHAHSGSGVDDGSTWLDHATFLAACYSKYFEGMVDTPTLHLGGGLPIPYKPDDVAIDLFLISHALREFKSKSEKNYRMTMEPGRYLVGSSGVLLAEVTQLKHKGETSFVGVNTGMHHLIRPSLYSAYHHIVNLTRVADECDMTADVVGVICESGDFLGKGRQLPSTTTDGDVILIADAGAYGSVMSSDYNLHARAHERMLSSADPNDDGDSDGDSDDESASGDGGEE